MAEFITPGKLPNKQKVISQLRRAEQPGLSQISVQWGVSATKQITQAPNQIVSLFDGERQIVYGYVDNCTSASLHALIGDKQYSTIVLHPPSPPSTHPHSQPLTLSLSQVSTHELGITRGDTIHALAARALIRDWADGVYSEDKITNDVIRLHKKENIIALSIQYSVRSQFSAFGMSLHSTPLLVVGVVPVAPVV